MNFYNIGRDTTTIDYNHNRFDFGNMFILKYMDFLVFGFLYFTFLNVKCDVFCIFNVILQYKYFIFSALSQNQKLTYTVLLQITISFEYTEKNTFNELFVNRLTSNKFL